MQFLNPLLLFGLLAVLIPIAVHLFNFRKYRKVFFSNVKFLKELKQQTRKQSNLLHRLVLLFRILTFTFIALAFAQPFIGSKKAIHGNRSNMISVYVDNSFSMEAQGTHGTLLDEARDKAREIAAAYSQDDQFQLLTNDFEGKHQRFVSRDEFLTMLHDVEVSSSVRSLDEITSRQSDLLSQDKQSNALLHLISDFQKSTILSSVPDSGLAQAQGYFIPLKPATTGNLYIDTCWFSNPVLQLGSTSTLNVKIVNVSETKLEKIPVKLTIDNLQRSAASIDINAGSSQEVSFTFTNNKAGYTGGTVEINDFPVTYDDVYFFSYLISKEIPVLCINEKDDNSYISSVYAVDSIINLTNATIRQIDFSSLSSYKLIILNSLQNFSSGFIQEIVKFAENGGSVMVIPSLNASADLQNTLLTGLGSDLLRQADEASIRISKINTNHPVYSQVFEQGTFKTENLDYPVITNHYELLHTGSVSSETLLELENNEPFLSVNAVGSGKAYLFATELDDKRGNFVRHALFVPTMLNIAFLSERLSPLMYYIDYQKPIPVSGSYKASDNILKITADDNNYEFIPEFRKINGQNFIFINNQVKSAGLKKLWSNDQQVQSLAFNYNRKESDLTVASETELEALKEKTGYEIIHYSPKPLDKLLNERTAGNGTWKYLIIGALLALASEIALLAFFKRRYASV